MVSEAASYFELFPVYVEWINTDAVGASDVLGELTIDDNLSRIV